MTVDEAEAANAGANALRAVLLEIAEVNGCELAEVQAELAERLRDGVRRPGSWEAQHVNALLAFLGPPPAGW